MLEPHAAHEEGETLSLTDTRVHDTKLIAHGDRTVVQIRSAVL
jgi:hypothetical protein